MPERYVLVVSWCGAFVVHRAGARLLFPAALPTNVLDLATGTALDPQHARQVHNFNPPTDHQPEPFIAVYPPVLMLVDATGMDTLFIHGAPGDLMEAPPIRLAIRDALPEEAPTFPFTDDLPTPSNILRNEPPPFAESWLEPVAWPDSTIPYTANILDDGDAVTLDVPLPHADVPPLVVAVGYNLHADVAGPAEAYHFADAVARPTFFAVAPLEHRVASLWTDAELIGDGGLMGGNGPDALFDLAPELLAFPRMRTSDRVAA